ESLTLAPILAHPNDNEEYVLYTDTFHLAMGAILIQKGNNGVEHVIEYASRTTNAAEKNYTITELECAAIVWAIKKFYLYLHGLQFTIVTDHSALTYLKSIVNPTGQMAHYIMILQGYNFVVKHKSGKQLFHVD
ncbi:12527_t:CDS:1, partial [Gigaspora margarita]